MSDKIDIDNIRYSIETQEFFQRQVEEAVNTLINKNNTESDKAFSWFMNQEQKNYEQQYKRLFNNTSK